MEKKCERKIKPEQNPCAISQENGKFFSASDISRRKHAKDQREDHEIWDREQDTTARRRVGSKAKPCPPAKRRRQPKNGSAERKAEEKEKVNATEFHDIFSSYHF